MLLLGNHEQAREATDTLNRIIFHQLSKLLICRPGKVENDETWIFLDELREAGKLSGLRQLLLRGRSKGVAVALGFQDVRGIYSAYGDHDGAEIIGSAQNAVVLHINPSAPQTAEWAASLFGSRRDVVHTHGLSTGDKVNVSTGQQLDNVQNLLPVELMQLPMPSETRGLFYYVFTNEQGHGKGHYEAKWLEANGLNTNSQFKDFEDWSDDFKPRLTPWDPEDMRRLGISELNKTATSGEAKKTGISALEEAHASSRRMAVG